MFKLSTLTVPFSACFALLSACGPAEIKGPSFGYVDPDLRPAFDRLKAGVPEYIVERNDEYSTAIYTLPCCALAGASGDASGLYSPKQHAIWVVEANVKYTRAGTTETWEFNEKGQAVLLAHEIGHVFLGPGHAETGLMRPTTPLECIDREVECLREALGL